ncbi:MAG: endonuclease/exonuclease/phosphatase family protein [Bacteroidales bacterium]|nr:endonuclease/exonuclease/phosphatase family protein [Bacteroidales bacterium]
MRSVLNPALIALAAVLIASCTKEEQGGEGRLSEITVSTEATTKTTLDGSSVHWSSGDRLMVFASGNSTGSSFRLGSGAGTGNGIFYGAEPSGDGNFFATYPSTATYNGASTFTYTLPSEVSYTKGGFASGSNPMLSATANSLGGFTMKNLCGVLKLRLLGGFAVKRIELTFDKPVCGPGTVSRGGNTLSMSGGSDSYKTVAVDCGSGVQLDATEPVEFYVVIPANTYGSMTVKAYKAEREYSTSTHSSPFTISRSAQTTMQTTLPAPQLEVRPELKVWSFNIACQKNDDNSSWGSSHYWSKRKDAVYAFFNTQEPDIIGTQECEYRQRVNILNNTSGYAAYGLGTEYGKESDGGSGSAWDKITGNYKDYNTDSSNAIFYKEDKFDVLDRGTFWLSSNPSSVGSDDGHNCAWIKFQWKENGYVFYFFNTHFTAHYTSSAYAARKAECTVLYDQISAINTEQLPMVIVGDFNAATSELYSSDKGDTRLSNWYWARNQDGKTSKTDYPTSNNNFSVTYNGSSWSDESSNIDHIAYKYFYENAKHGLKAGSFGTDTYAYEGVTYISDHWPIYATLVFDYQ